MNVVLYVMNDLSHDARVIREAQTLGAAGHRVTVIATTTGPEEPSGSRESRTGFDVVHVAVPRRWPLWYVWLKHPWRLARRAADELHGVVRRPKRLPQTLVLAALSLLSLPWMVVRATWDAFLREVLRRPAGPGPLDYILRWRAFHLGWAQAAVALGPVADIHHANDMDTLPAAIAGARRDGGRVIYDSHEIYLESRLHVRQPAWIRWLMRRWERAMVARAAAVVTVNEACATELVRRVRPRRVVVVHNCPPRPAAVAGHPSGHPPGQDRRLREAVGVPSPTPLVLYHGTFSPGRGLEQLAAALLQPGLAGVHAAFLGYGAQRGLLEELAADPVYRGRIHVLPPVPPDEVVGWVAGADLDVMAIQPSSLNHVLSTPNKLFEALAAGVPVVASDFPGMRAIVIGEPDGAVGEVCDPTDPAAIAAAIERILDLADEERAALRARCRAAADRRWNWETESVRLVELYASLDGAAADARGTAAALG